MSMPTESFLRSRFELTHTLLHRKLANTEQQGNLEKEFTRQETLKHFFTEHGLLHIREQVNLRTRAMTERCMLSLLLFAEEHIPAATKNITHHTLWTPSNALYLGNHSLVQLNYITYNQEESVFSLFQRAITALGRRALRLRLLHPSSSRTQIERKLKEIDFCMGLPPETSKAVDTQLRLMFDISRLHRKIMTYSCEAVDILALYQSYETLENLIELVGHTRTPFCFDAWDDEFQTYKREFLRIFDMEKARRCVNNEDVSFFQDAVAPATKIVEEALEKLYELAEQSVNAVREWAGLSEDVLVLEKRGDQSTFQLTIKKQSVKSVKDRMGRNGNPHNIQIQVRQSVRSYIEYPELTALAIQYERKRVELQNTMVLELSTLCKQVMTAGEEIWPTLEDWVGTLDSTLALTKVCRERNYCRPTVLEPNGHSGFQAIGLRHPLLEATATTVQYVKHDISLGFQDKDDKGWLLYGMNASGKSSLMKSIGIAVLLAQAGCYVPATSFTLYPFKSLLTRILNQDNIWAGLSSFAVEMSELRDIFSRAEAHSLVLGDELCSGTESVSATSLVAAGIRYLTQQGTRFVFATHLHGLDTLDTFPGVGIWHLRCHYDPVSDRLIYDRTLHPGPGTTTYGIEVARAMHIPMEIIERAFAYRRKLEGETSIQEARQSQYNHNIVLRQCGRCGQMRERTLEVHHIQYQRTANAQGILPDGTHMNDPRNLITLCEDCHQQHHQGAFEIGTVVQTDRGEMRQFTETNSVRSDTIAPSIVTPNREIIERYLLENPKMPLKLLASHINCLEGLQITEAIVRSVRKKMEIA